MGVTSWGGASPGAAILPPPDPEFLQRSARLGGGSTGNKWREDGDGAAARERGETARCAHRERAPHCAHPKSNALGSPWAPAFTSYRWPSTHHSGGQGMARGSGAGGSRSFAGPVLLQRSRGRSRSLPCQHQRGAQHRRSRDVCVGPPRSEELKDFLKHGARFTFPRAALIFPALSGEWGEPCTDRCPSPRHAELPLQNRSGTTKFQELLKGTTFIRAQRGPFGLSPTRNAATRILPSHN